MTMRLAFLTLLAASANEVTAFAPSSLGSKNAAEAVAFVVRPQAVTHSNAVKPLALLGHFRQKKSDSIEASTLDEQPVETEEAMNDDITEEEVRSLFTLWNDALAGMQSFTARTDFDFIKDYFENFLLRNPKGEIKEGHIRIGDGWEKDSGIYEFTMGADGTKVKGRYSFIYIKEYGQWKIMHHHD
jgi:hypothetical protein